MDVNKLKKWAQILFVVLFVMPIIASLLSRQTADDSTLLWLGMGLFNLPFVAVSLISWIAGGLLQNRQKIEAASTAFGVSIASSIVGSVLIFVWGLKA